jgi:ubiquinone/menaquinone biosynthesis C-methylase UbiE
MGKYLTEVETNFLLKSVDFSKLSLILDVGAEAGRFSLFAANRNITVVGIDIDSYSLRRLKQKNKDVTVIQADARRMPLKPDVFDAVFMIEVLDYISERTEAIAESFRLLKANSPLLLSFGNKSSLKATLRKLQGKSYMHSYREVISSLLQVGFKVHSKLGYSWAPLGRTSNSRIVSIVVYVERVFGLKRIPRYSPWVIVYATKTSCFPYSKLD